MSRLRTWIRRTRGVFARRRHDVELADELLSHLDAHIADNIRAGMTPDEARRRALVALGGIAQTQELHRSVRSFAWVDDACEDVRYAFRTARRSPGFTATAVTVIALGIAATVAAFTVLDYVLLRPLPFPQPDRLVRIYQSDLARGVPRLEASPPNFTDWRAGSASFSAMASFLFNNPMTLLGDGEPRQIEAATLDADVLTVLGVQPLVGRGFTAADERNFLTVAILSYDFAVTTFGSPAAALDRKLTLDNRARTVVGVMPRGFAFPSRDPVLWVPMIPVDILGQSRTNLLLNVVARLRPGVSIGQAQAEMNVMADRLQRAYPKDNAGVSITFVDMRDVVSPQTRMLVWTVFAAAFCLLLIVCTNLTNLLLARAVARRQEIAVRAAIGAGLWRLVKQMLTESALIAATGGLLGSAIAMGTVPLVARIVPNVLPVSGAPAVDLRVLAFAVAITIVTCLAVGVVPALRSARTADAQALRARAGEPVGRLRAALVLAEVAATVTLLVAGGLLVKAMWRVQSVDLGFQAGGVLTLRTNLPFLKYPNYAGRRNFYGRVLSETRALPGVVSVGYTTGLPLVLGAGIMQITVPGVVDDPVQTPRASIRFVTPDYFATVGIPLRSGRFVDGRDTATTAPAAVISEALARRLWPGENPIGRQLVIYQDTRTVVGVAGDIVVRGLERTSEPQIYMSPEQLAPFGIFYAPRDLVVRASGDALSLAPAIRKIIHDADPEQPITNLRLFDDIVAEQTASRRDQLVVLGLFATVAFLLAAIGIHGLLSYTVQARMREVGVRIALGAAPRVIVQMFLQQGVALGVIGVAAAMPLAYAAGRAMNALLFGLSAADPSVYLMAAGVALTMTIASSVMPALRAAGIDPAITMRTE
jgi:putative ABC transport system permease protein